MYEYKAKITNVVDGDTYDAIVDLGFYINFAIRIRLEGINTPETWRPINEAENTHGLEATALVQKAVDTNPYVRIVTYKHGASMYYRYTAEVYFTDENGEEYSIADRLVSEGLERKDDEFYLNQE